MKLNLHFLFSGRTPVDLLNLWRQDASWVLETRCKGDIQVDLFKVVGERQVLAYSCFY